MEKNTIVAIYARVSSQDQVDEGYSIEEQQRRLKALAEARDWTVYKTYVDPGFSGSNIDRPAIQALITDAKNHKFDMVMIYKLDRLSRSQKDTMYILEDVLLPNNVDLLSISESFDTSTPFGRAMIGILSVFAQLERENIRERTTMGRRARISKGYNHSSSPALGYTFKEGTNNLIKNPYEALIVKDIFDWFVNGESIKGISVKIGDKYGNNIRQWRNTLVRRILRNPVYIGKVCIGEEMFDGIHEPIIDDQVFYKAQELLKRNKELDRRTYAFSTATGVADHLLTNILYCGDCGARMSYNKVSKNISRYLCYSISKRNKSMIKSENCSNRLYPFTAEQLEQIIIGEISKLAMDPDYIAETIKASTPEDTTAPIQGRIDDVNKQISKLLDLYQLGFTDLGQITEKLTSLKDEKEKLEKQLSQETVTRSYSPGEVKEMLEDFNEIMEYGSPEELHRIIHTLINKIVILNDDIKIYWSFC